MGYVENFFAKKGFSYESIAEFGFGAGLTLRYASSIFNEVYGFDISKKNIEKTKDELQEEGFSNIYLFHLDVLQCDKRFKNYFDVISFIHGLEHFSEKDFPIFFNNIKYYLKNHGVFCGALPNNLQFNFRICPRCNHIFEIDGHLSTFDKNKLKELFENYNFKIVHLSDFNYKYYLKSKGISKTLYRILFHKIFHRKSNNQLEFIVQPLNK